MEDSRLSRKPAFSPWGFGAINENAGHAHHDA